MLHFRKGLWAAKLALAFAVACSFNASADIQIHNSVQGSTPDAVGYNLGFFRAGSNSSDWWRYSGIKTVRVFMSVKSMEPSDDKSPKGDNVNSKTSFNTRKTALRADSSGSLPLSNTYVNWPYFESKIATAGDAYNVGDTFPALRSLGVEILANVSAVPSRFPITSATDYAGMWEMWQHYYAVAFILGRDYDVRRYGMYNEPNLSDALTMETWELRLRIASDAIRAGIADMNARYGRSLQSEILAPNTANPEYFNDDWGHTAILSRYTDLFGDPTATRNFDVYNFQKYGTSQLSGQYTGYIDACQSVKDGMTGDMGTDPILPVALTEMNARTGAAYSSRPENADTPGDYVSVGASAIALTNNCPTGQLYLFKFGMMEAGSSTWESKLAKNGTHYVNIDDTPGALNNYGGASGTAEVWRLYGKAAGLARDSYSLTSDQDPNVWIMATRTQGVTYVYLANRTTAATPIAVDLSALSIAEGSLATVEEVSLGARGGVVGVKHVTSGRVDAGTMPAESVWLISVYDGATASGMQTVSAGDSTQLRDGSYKNTVVAVPASLLARADSTINGRRTVLIKFPVSGATQLGKRVLLRLNTAQHQSSTTPTQVHVYGINYDTWDSATTSFDDLTTVFAQNIPAGDLIANNVVLGQGTVAKIQGQLVASSTSFALKYIDVTDFITSQSDGYATILLVQDHRWDYPSNALAADVATGDTQDAGIYVRSGGASPPVLLVY